MHYQRVLSVLVLLLSFSFSAHANLVNNGDFESNDLTGWTLTNGANPLTVVDTLSPHSGLSSASFGAFQSVDTISQSLSTTSAAVYNLSFWLANSDTQNSNTFEVWWDGALLQSWVDANPFSYTLFTYQVTATSASTLLEFKGFNDDGYFGLDDVSVPEPELLGLISLGLVCLVSFKKRHLAA
ncbi:MAG: hypothetical protein NTV43_05505 [Methylococcales bacterium]|nr:hypothetical protein [Methylococcales bacterium]